MSYDIKLNRSCDHRVYEDQITDIDRLTVILNKTMVSASDTTVRINDFVRPANFITEEILREDVSDQITVTNNRLNYTNPTGVVITVARPPIMDGLKIGNMSSNFEDITVRIKVTEEDVSSQFTGDEIYLVTEGKPILRDSEYDYTYEGISGKDVTVTVNGFVVDVVNITAKIGVIQLKYKPIAGDTVKVTYRFKAAVKTINSEEGVVVLKEMPLLGQEVKIAYFAKINDGWYTQKSSRSYLPNASDVVFYKNKNTDRSIAVLEDDSEWFQNQTANDNPLVFRTKHWPLLPLFQNFQSTPSNTLNNAITVFLNGKKTPVADINPNDGYVKLTVRPTTTDLVQATYYWQNERVVDRIGVEYTVAEQSCSKCRGNKDMADYCVNPIGSYLTVDRENKLIQDLKKIIVTILGSDKVATWYGTTFEKMIGQKMLFDYTKTRISGEIIEALTRLKNAQIKQEEYQEVTDNEFLDFISGIVVTQSEEDASYYSAEVAVVTQAGTAFVINQPLIYPEDRLYATTGV